MLAATLAKLLHPYNMARRALALTVLILPVDPQFR